MNLSGGLPMKILALEFSSVQRSVAVIQQRGPGMEATHPVRTTSTPPIHINEVIETGGVGGNTISMIEAVLGEAGLEREQIQTLVIGLGPGSYSGIRRAIAAAQGWQLARDEQVFKLLGISSVDCLAAQAISEGIAGPFNVVIDAQRGEFYLAVFESGPEGARNLEPLRLATLDELKQRETRGEYFFGPEAARFQNGRVTFPSASKLAELALAKNDFVPGEMLEPIYLRATEFVKTQTSRKIS
jgi:tRNA threonylcarbamoyladenosine biosynthesis protein TsaB